MRLAPGSRRLGPYEIQHLLGSGGMGEVYQAHDPRLHRQVAIKVLPTDDVGDALAVTRMHREAEAVAALQHPGICSIFDIGEHGGAPFLVMERLVGETLSSRVAKGPIDVQTLVKVGIAVADALAAAHAAGVIHRDLKPANIFLTARSDPKILDFGLAKPLRDSELTTTIERARTGPGAAAGTVAYMSPEQLRGGRLDARSDIFSLGLVLYEMAAGKHAFGTGSSATIAAAILMVTPPAFRISRPDAPPELERIVLRAIEKDPELRYQSAADLCSDLKGLARHSSGESTDDKSGSLATSNKPVGPVRMSRRRAWLLGVAIIGPLGIGAIAWMSRVPASVTDSPPTTLEIKPLSFSGDIRSAAISQDGRFIAFVRADALWVRQVSANPGERDVQLVPRVPGRTYQHPTITPSGEHVDFTVIEGSVRELWRVPLLGGTPQRIVQNVWSGVGWSPDGRKMAFLRTKADFSELVVANADGTGERTVARRQLPLMFITAANPGAPVSRPSWSPDGRQVLVLGVKFSPEGREPEGELVFVDPTVGGPVRARGTGTRQIRQATWMDDERLIIEATETRAFGILASTDLNGENWTPLTREFAAFVDFAPTRDRRSAIVIRVERRTGIWVGDNGGGNLRPLIPEDSSGIAYPREDAAGNLFYSALLNDGATGLYRVSAAAGERTLLTNRLLAPEHWSVSPDGKFVVFTGRESPYPLFRVNSDGSGPVTLVERNAGAPAITPDGQSVLFAAFGPGLLSVPLAGGPVRQLSDINVNSVLSLSSDGLRVAFLGDQPHVAIVCAINSCERPASVKLSPIGFLTPIRWAAGMDAIAFIKADDPTNLWAQPLAGGPPKQLTNLSERPIQEFAWSAGGSRLLLSRGSLVMDVALLTGLR